MASELELRWLKTTDLKGAAKRFAVFCKEDIKTQAESGQFNLDVYQDAIKIVLSKLDHSVTLAELTKKIAAEEEPAQASEDSVVETDSNNNDESFSDHDLTGGDPHVD